MQYGQPTKGYAECTMSSDINFDFLVHHYMWYIHMIHPYDKLHHAFPWVFYCKQKTLHTAVRHIQKATTWPDTVTLSTQHTSAEQVRLADRLQCTSKQKEGFQLEIRKCYCQFKLVTLEVLSLMQEPTDEPLKVHQCMSSSQLVHLDLVVISPWHKEGLVVVEVYPSHWTYSWDVHQGTQMQC